MYQQTPWLAGLILAGVVSVGAAQDDMFPLQGPIDVQALRAQVLGDSASLEELMDDPQIALPEPAMHPLGITFKEIPELLYLHCPDLADGRGLLIADVCEHGLGAQAGLEPNHILLQFGDRVLHSPSDLPAACHGEELYLLDHGNVCSVAVPELSTSPRISQPHCPHRNRAARSANRGAYAASSVSGNASEAVAISVTNGYYQISTQVETEDGPQEFRIEGTRKEVERQLLGLPENVANAIRNQLSPLDVR